MKKFYYGTLLAFVATVLFAPLVAQHQVTTNQNIYKNLGALSFEENKGQAFNPDEPVLFLLKDKGMTVFFHADGITYQWHHYKQPEQESPQVSEATGLPISRNDVDGSAGKFETATIRMKWINSSKDVEIIPSDKDVFVTNYYLPNNPQGLLNVGNFKRLVYKNIYPNVDVVYYFKDGNLKYDIVLHQNSKAADVKMNYIGASGLTLK
jgi:hypothetical protein